jgi:hypothetical protein
MFVPKGYLYLQKNSDCMWICYVLIAGIILLLLIPAIRSMFEPYTPLGVDESSEHNGGAADNAGVLPDSVRNAVCHPACCMQQQWPVEHMLKPDIDLTNYVKSEYSCKSCQNGVGCLCFTKEDYEKLKNNANY